LEQQQSKAAVLAFLDAMADGDHDALSGMLHDDSRWWVPMSAAARGLDRPLIGKERIADLASGRVTRAFRPGTSEWDVMHLVGDATMVAALVRRRAVGANGRPYDNEYHWLFRFADGSIIEVWEVLDTALAFELLAPDPPSAGS
jgi:ketosteroid isomerase-like protein